MSLCPARPLYERVEFDDLQNPLGVQHIPILVASDLSALHHAALIGVGVVQLTEVMVRDDLAAGRLVELSPQYRPSLAGYTRGRDLTPFRLDQIGGCDCVGGLR